MGCGAVGTVIELPSITNAPSTPGMDEGAGYTGGIIWSSDKVRPVVVTAETIFPAAGNAGVKLFANFGLPGAPAFTTGYAMTAFLMGHMKISYGSAATQKVIYTDLGAGSIQLPPCSFVQVQARRRNPTGSPLTLANDYRLKVSVAEGYAHPDAPLPTCTTELGEFNAGTAAAKTISTPPSCVDFELLHLQPNVSMPRDIQVNYGPGCYVDYSIPGSWPTQRYTPAIPGGVLTTTPAGTAGLLLNTALAFSVVP